MMPRECLLQRGLPAWPYLFRLRPPRFALFVRLFSFPDLGFDSPQVFRGKFRLLGQVQDQVLDALLDWRGELQAHNVNSLFAVPVPTLNLGHIHGGDNPNRICAACELQLDLRPLPGMHIDELRTELHRRTRRTLADSGIGIRFEALFDGIPAMETPADAGIVRLAERLTGYAPGAVAFGTEAPYLSRLGMETVVLGPGWPGVLLHEAERANADVICLISDAHPDYPDARSAARLIEALDQFLPKLKLDPQPLIDEADKIEKQIQAAIEQAKPVLPMQPKTDSSVMYG